MLILETILIFNTLLNDLMCTLLNFYSYMIPKLQYCQQNQTGLNENSGDKLSV